jgi:ABC-type antimicrobial peptide transport system permease subunit
MLLLASFAAIALLLTVVGLYGVLSYAVVRRMRELGVRIALGASRGMIVGMVLKQAMLLVLAGISIGLAGAYAASRLMSQMLFGVRAGDPVLLGIACGVILITAALAAYLPARRAASIDPMRALRIE